MKWSYPDGFGYYLAHGAIGQNGAQGFVGAQAWGGFTVFQANPWSPVWDWPVFNIGAIAVADLDGDGQDEIIEGDAQWGYVHVYDTVTRDLRHTIANPGYTVRAVGAIDPFGWGRGLVAFSSDTVPAYLADPRTQEIIWKGWPVPEGPYSAVALGRSPGSGRFEFTFGSAGDNYYGGPPGILTTIDPWTGVIGWQSPAAGADVYNPYYLQPRVLRQDGSRMIVAGRSTYDVRLLAVDLQTHEIAWRVGTYASGPMQSREVSGAALWDVDGDAIADIVVSTHAITSAASDAKLFVFSGADGSLVWQSVSTGNGFIESGGVLAGLIDPAFGPELVAVLPDGLRAYNVQTKLLDWTLEVEASGASLVEAGEHGAEIAVFHEDTLKFFDGATRNLLRSFVLNAEITAVAELDDVRRLLVAAGDRLHVVNGIDGTIMASSDYLGSGLAARNQLAVARNDHGMWLVGAGSDFGIFRYCLGTGGGLFVDGFESDPPMPAGCVQ